MWNHNKDRISRILVLIHCWRFNQNYAFKCIKRSSSSYLHIASGKRVITKYEIGVFFKNQGLFNQYMTYKKVNYLLEIINKRVSC